MPQVRVDPLTGLKSIIAAGREEQGSEAERADHPRHLRGDAHPAGSRTTTRARSTWPFASTRST